MLATDLIAPVHAQKEQTVQLFRMQAGAFDDLSLI
jgi:hypothetical protein